VTQLKKAPLIALLTANAISMVGNVFALIAIPWFVLQTTGSPAKTGLTGFFMTLAAVVATFFGGAIVDRLGFKRTSILADITSGGAFALIPLLYAVGWLQLWHLLTLVFAGNFLDAPGTTAREALIPELAESSGMGLERASALVQAVERGSRMVGAPLAGALIAFIGTKNVIWIDAISFAISGLIVWICVPASRIHVQPISEERRYLADVREGIEFILHDKLLLAMVLIVVVTNFIDTPLLGVVYPVYFQRIFGSAVGLGMVVSASGAGALITALVFGAIGHRLSRRTVFWGGFLLTTLRFFVFAMVPPLWVLVIVALINGLGAGPINPIISTISYERIPVNYRGRVLGTMTAIAYVAMPLGTVLAGFALERVGIRPLLLSLGVLYLATILVAMISPAFRHMNLPKPCAVEVNTIADS
jgi:MFS family permease